MSQEVFVLEEGHQYIDIDGEHNKNKAIDFMKSIGNKKYVYKGERSPYSKLEKADLLIGAYRGGYVLSNFDVAWSAIFERQFIRSVLKTYNNSKILSLVYYDTCLVSGYAYFENGKLIRSATESDGLDGVSEKGQILEEEKKSVLDYSVSSFDDCEDEDRRTVEIDGKEYFICRNMLLEKRGLELVARFLKDLDDEGDYGLGVMSCFSKRPWFSRLF